MIINPVIVGALLVQAGISRVSRVAGAVTGFVITTGILVWGLAAYGEGNVITFIGIPLSQQVFLGLCMMWYFFDAKEFAAAQRSSAAAEAPAGRALPEEGDEVGRSG